MINITFHNFPFDFRVESHSPLHWHQTWINLISKWCIFFNLSELTKVFLFNLSRVIYFQSLWIIFLKSKICLKERCFIVVVQRLLQLLKIIHSNKHAKSQSCSNLPKGSRKIFKIRQRKNNLLEQLNDIQIAKNLWNFWIIRAATIHLKIIFKLFSIA